MDEPDNPTAEIPACDAKCSNGTFSRRRSKKSLKSRLPNTLTEGDLSNNVSTPSSTPDRSMKKVLKVGNYVLLKALGKGSSGEVKLGQNVESNEFVAIKVINKDWITKNEKEKAITNEINIMSSLKHPNIVELKEVMNGSTAIYLVMEYIEGEELFNEIVKHRKIDETTARNYFEQIVDGLSYLHSHGIAHRDIKPENILINKDGKLKITDFGFSVKCLNSQTPRVSEDLMCGTPHYTAPEVFNFMHSTAYDPRCSDVWSAGVVLFTMLSGHLPFEGSTAVKALELICTENVTFPDYFSPEVCNLLYEMLNKDVNTRISIEDITYHHWLTNDKSFSMESLDEVIPKLSDISNFKKRNPFFSNAQNEAMYSPMSSFGSTMYSASPRSPCSSPSPIKNMSPQYWLANPSPLRNEAVPPAKGDILTPKNHLQSE